jgi:hypothetical protein
MIGVLADPSDRSVVREFFELFKTPWEFYRSEQEYDVVLCANDPDGLKEYGARLVLIYNRENLPDATCDSRVSVRSSHSLLYKGLRLPLYFSTLTFADGNPDLLADATSHEPVVRESRRNVPVVIRIGYDLFREVRYLLTVGQPIANAASPTLDLHIALLRDLILSANIPLIEIPPIPFGYHFIACLTHDIDHPFVLRHKFDHTMFGFLYRAIIGSGINFIRGRTSASNVLRNWLAALKLPFVHLGFATDFWSDFDRYTEIEGDCRSSFFVIPFKNRPGRTSDGIARHRRGAAYGAIDVAGQLRRLMAANCEIGLHGIDAWVDSTTGREELAEIRGITGACDIGVRMHWLFFDKDSPVVLENAGATYDSTVGYNETVGYRAGTNQVYRPLNATKLLEVPLLIMDTALFYPSHLHLSPKDATARINEIIDTAVNQGGCITVNWHDRSIAPERLWTDTYVKLVNELKGRGAWFATASQATAWFQMRRSVKFEVNRDGAVHSALPVRWDEGLPPLTLRTYSTSSGEPKDIVLTRGNRNSPISDVTLDMVGRGTQ